MPDGLSVPGPQLVAVQFGTALGRQRFPIGVEQLAFHAVPIRTGSAENDRVGQITCRAAAADDLPVQQARLSRKYVLPGWESACNTVCGPLSTIAVTLAKFSQR
jgi:hypothetical protein